MSAAAHPSDPENEMDGDTMVRFSIAPTACGSWLWRTIDREGRLRAHGLAPTRKLAAALVIRDIIHARADQVMRQPLHLTAKAA